MEKKTPEYVTVRPRFRQSAKWGAKVLTLWVRPEGATRSKVLELSVTADYVTDWTLTHALRELIANALDSGGEAKVSHYGHSDPRQNETKIENWDGASMDLTHFLLGGGESQGGIGQFREGLKLALLVLCRERIPVKLRYGADSCQVTIRGLDIETVESAKGLFWALRDPRPRPLNVDRKGRAIYLATKAGEGEAFVQGLKQPVGTEELYWSYNLPKRLVPIARDRHIADLSKLQGQLSRAVLTLESPALMKEAIEAILARDAAGSKPYFDLDPSRIYWKFYSWQHKAWCAFIKSHFEGRVLVDNANQAYVVEGLGKIPIRLASGELRSWLTAGGLEEFADVAPDFWDLETRKIRKDSRKLGALLGSIDALWPSLDSVNFTYRTFKGKFASDRRDGFMKDHTVYISEKTWLTKGPKHLLGLMVHELAHVEGTDLSVEFENALSDLLGEAALAHFEANASESMIRTVCPKPLVTLGSGARKAIEEARKQRASEIETSDGLGALFG